MTWNKLIEDRGFISSKPDSTEFVAYCVSKEEESGYVDATITFGDKTFFLSEYGTDYEDILDQADGLYFAIKAFRKALKEACND